MKVISEYTEVISSSDADKIIECKCNVFIFTFTQSEIMSVITKCYKKPLINCYFWQIMFGKF